MLWRVNTIAFNLAVLWIVTIFYVLYLWANIIIPFIIAILLAFAIISLSTYYRKFLFTSYFPTFFSILTYLAIFWIVWNLIGSSASDVVEVLPSYQEKVEDFLNFTFSYFQIEPPKTVSEAFAKYDIASIITGLLSATRSIFSSAWIIIFYLVFILLEHRHFSTKLKNAMKKKDSYDKINNVISKIQEDIKSYFVIKTIVSLVTSILTYIVLMVAWVDFAILWAFLTFILNFIPSVGSIMAVLFPMAMSLIQFDSLLPFWIISILLFAIQFTMWNVIEPRFLWNKLNLSPLVIILNLAFWGTLWWVVWMILSVPIIVVVNIILANLKSTRSVAIMLSEKWEIWKPL